MRKRMRIVCYVVLFLLAVSASLQAQDTWDNYQPRTLKELVERNAKLLTEGEARASPEARVHLLFTHHFPSRVKVTYTGEKRPIPAKRKEFIAGWATSRKLRQEIVDLFEEELLFKEISSEYWLPVQKQVIPYFAEELKKGDTVEIYLILTGARTEDKVSDWVFLVNEFKK